MIIATSLSVRSRLLAPSVMLRTGAALLSVGACTSDTPPSPAAQSLGGARGHAIHVFAVDGDGTKQRLDFGPGTELVDTTVSGSATAALQPQDIQLQAFDAGGTPVVPPPSVEAPESVTSTFVPSGSRSVAARFAAHASCRPGMHSHQRGWSYRALV